MSDTGSKFSSLGDYLTSGDVKTMGQDAINKQVAKNSLFPSLSFKQRIMGFIVCAALGAAFGFLSFIIILSATHSPARFAIPYSISILCLILSTFFLIGPLKQLKVMFHKTRVITSIVLLVSIAMVIFSAFIFKSAFLVLAFVILEMLAFVWYALSFIPYARTAFITLVKHGCKNK